MREFKFRAWDIDRKRMIFFENLSISWFYEDDYAIEAGEKEGTVIDRGGIVHDDFKDTPPNAKIMQYTGLKDKNGTEIYEGDIVKHKHKFGGGLGQVKYIVPSFGLRDLHKPAVSTDFEWTDFEEFEVIGNIYENPELKEELH